MEKTIRPLTLAGFVLGMAFAGFTDGIVLHQILQWHHMICTTATCHPVSIADLQRKDRQDGYFHLFVFALTLLGCFELFRAGKNPEVLWSGPAFGGAIVAGAGFFNFLEGLIDHEILHIHHVRPGPQQTEWDLGFLALALVLLVVGYGLMRSARPPSSTLLTQGTSA